jgi:Mitochondrial carrier protein
MHVLTAGGLAGASSWLSVYPIDVLKSRIQVLRCPAMLACSALTSAAWGMAIVQAVV